MPRPSGTYFEEEQDTLPALQTLTDAVTLCQGIAERGPLTPQLCRSDTEFFRIFGGYTPDNFDTVAAVQQYFDNGGRLLIFCRVVHHSDPLDPTTATCATGQIDLQTSALVAGSGSILSANAAPYDLEPGDTIVVSVDGGGNLTATFNATAASRDSGNGPFALVNGQQLTVSVDGGPVQTLTFATGEFANIGAATPAETAAAINGKITGAKATVVGSAVRLTSDKRGLGSGVNVTGGTANAVLGYTTGNIAGTGNVQNIDAVTSAEFKTVVEGAVAGVTVTAESGRQRITSNTSGGSSSVQVQVASSADDEIGFDNALHAGSAAGAQNTLRAKGKTPGAYANALRVVIASPTSGEAGRFNLYVERAGVVVERYLDLSMLETDTRYALRVVNSEVPGVGSNLIALEDLNAPAAFPSNAPATGTFGPLTGGSDGLVSLSDNDFIGGSGANGKVGLRKFDTEDGDLLMSPQRATPAVQNAVVTYCEVTREGKIYPVFDPPAGYSSTQIVTYSKNTALLYDLTEYGCLDWPRIKVTNPNKAIYGDAELLVAPTSGTRCGLCARVESAKEFGVFDQPGGNAGAYLPRNVRGLETDEVLDDNVRGFVFDANINPITRKRSKRPGSNGQFGPVYFDGVRNLKRTGNWPSIGQRRGVIWTKKQLDDLMDPTRHRNITDELIDQMKDKADQLLRNGARAGAFASRVPEEAYILDFGTGQNTAATRKAGQTHGRVGLATSNANEFVFIKIGPDNRQLAAELAAQ
jgi:hypothetical protein